MEKPPPLDTNLIKLELTVRSYNALRYAGILTLGDLLQRSPRELLKVKNFGRVSLADVEDRLVDLGLDLPASPAFRGRGPDLTMTETVTLPEGWTLEQTFVHVRASRWVSHLTLRPTNRAAVPHNGITRRLLNQIPLNDPSHPWLVEHENAVP